MLRRPPRSTPFPTRRSSDLLCRHRAEWQRGHRRGHQPQQRLPEERLRGSFRDVRLDRKSTRLNSSHSQISYAVFCLKKKKKKTNSVSTYYQQDIPKTAERAV